MKYASPESCGISTADIKDYIEQLEDDGLSTHSVIIARGDNIIFEKYWAPFNSDFKHRLYSVTKSFAALAIGFLADEGKVDINAPISRYFPEECAKITDEDIKNQTVRDMLMMRTAHAKGGRNWFTASPDDRVTEYFTANSGSAYPSHTVFRYDSSGSFVLGALCERTSGMNIIEYLDKKLFSKLGITDVDVLTCPGGHSWMDSGLLMRPIDLMKCARFVLNMGSWNGEQLLSREYLAEATSNLVPTTTYGETTYEGYGYGYQIWRTKHNSFFFNGMGCQLAVCNPDRDLILVYNGDNQGNSAAKTVIINGFFNTVYKNAKDEPLPEYRGEPIGEYSLFALPKTTTPEGMEYVNGREFSVGPNIMAGLKSFTLNFNDGEGTFAYTNMTGAKILRFGMGKNVFDTFPEESYSDRVGSKPAPGHKYNCASSGAWLSRDVFMIRVQIIDNYFGNLAITLGFKDKRVTVKMQKCAENFLMGYEGWARGELVASKK